MKTTKIALIIILELVFTLSVDVLNNRKPVLTIITCFSKINNSPNINYKSNHEFPSENALQLLQINSNLIIFGDIYIKLLVQKLRKGKSTVFIQIDESWFTQKWYSASLKELNPNQLDVVDPKRYSKLYLMSQAYKYDTMGSDYYIWMDPNIMENQNKGLFVPNNVLEKWIMYFQGSWTYHSFNADDKNMEDLNTFERPNFDNSISNMHLIKGDYFGGRVQSINTIKNIFQNLMKLVLSKTGVWNQEKIFTLMAQRYPYLINYVHTVELTMLDNITFHTPRHYEVYEERFIQISYDTNETICQSKTPSYQKYEIIRQISKSSAETTLEQQFLIQFDKIMTYDLNQQIIYSFIIFTAFFAIKCVLRRIQKYSHLSNSNFN